MFCADLRRLREFQQIDPKTPAETKAAFDAVLPIAKRLASEAPATLKAAAEHVGTGIQQVAAVLAKWGFDIDKAIAGAKGTDQGIIEGVGQPDDPDAKLLNSHASSQCGTSTK